jgi:hypothetical protein
MPGGAGRARFVVLVTPILTRLPAPVDAIRSQAGGNRRRRPLQRARPHLERDGPARDLATALVQTETGVPVGVQLVGPLGRSRRVGIAGAIPAEQLSTR